MNKYVDFSYLAEFLKAIGSSHLAGVILELETRINNQTPETWQQYYDEHRRAVDHVMNCLGRGRSLSANCFKKIQTHMVAADRRLQEHFAIATPPVHGQDYENLKALHLLGVVSWAGESQLCPFFSPSLTMPILGYLSRMNEVDLRKHCASVQRLREPQLDDAEVRARVKHNSEYVLRFHKMFRTDLAKHATALLGANIESKRMLSIADLELLPTAASFYEGAIRYWLARFKTTVPLHYTFSMSPGVILPQEHYGSRLADVMSLPELADTIEKNPLRERYFSVLRKTQANKQRAYYFDAANTARKLQEMYRSICERFSTEKGDEYLKHAEDILNSYLKVPNFSLIEIKSFPTDTEFRHLMLGNSANLILTTRSETGNVAHGIWLRPKRLSITTAMQELDPWEISASFGADVMAAVLGSASPDPKSLAAAFVAAFGVPIFFVIRHWMKDRQARDMVFSISRRIKQQPIDTRIIKKIGKNPEKNAREIINGLMNARVEP